MRTNTKKFQVLRYIGTHQGVRAGDIQRFVCSISGLDYDRKEQGWAWNTKLGTSVPRMVRVNRGYWCTNLYYGPKSIVKQHCVKIDKRWFLNAETAKLVRDHFNTIGVGSTVYEAPKPVMAAVEVAIPKSSLDTADLPDDTIKGLGETVVVKRITIPVMQGPTINGPIEIKKPVAAPEPAPVELTRAEKIASAIKMMEETREMVQESQEIVNTAVNILNKARERRQEAEDFVRELLDL
jgi:hypothetical protein